MPLSVPREPEVSPEPWQALSSFRDGRQDPFNGSL